MGYINKINGVNPPDTKEGPSWSLFKIAWALWNAIDGNVGFLVRGNITSTPLPAEGADFSLATTQTINTGGVAQTVFIANANRVYFFILNTSDTIMYVDVTGVTATSASIPIQPNGGSYEPLVAPTDQITLLCATAGKTFCALQA